MHTHSHSPALTHTIHVTPLPAPLPVLPCAPLPEPADKGPPPALPPPLPLVLPSPAVAPLLPLAEAIVAGVAFPKDDSIARLLKGGVPVMAYRYEIRRTISEREGEVGGGERECVCV